MRRLLNGGWNKRGLLIGGIALAACSRQEPQEAPVAVTRSALQPAGLVAAYAFDEGAGVAASDASGNSNDGTLSDTVTWSPAGKHGGAASFSNAWVTVNENANLDLTTGMTAEAWVNPTTLPAFAAVVVKETPDNISYGLYASDATNNDGSDAHPRAWILTADGLETTAADGVLPLHQWTHIATTYDNSTLSYYVNGVLAASAAIPGPILTGDAPLRIGGDLPNDGESFDGLIDDVRVYNRALSSDEIATDMLAPVAPGQCAGVIIDDGNPCTADACDPSTGNVTHTPLAVGASCSDGNACNGAETCDASSTCVAGTPPTLDDGNPCTADACDPSRGVTHSVIVGPGCTGLVAAYSFDDGAGAIATDTSGNGNDGTLSDSVSWTALGKHGGAASFSFSWVTVNQNSTVDLTTGMTLEAWVNPNSPPGFTVIAAKETPDTIAYGLYAADTDGGGGEVPHPAAWVLTANGLNATFTDGVLPTNEWTHVAATYDNATLSYYINGVLASSTSVTGPIAIGDGPFRIGGDAPYGGEYFDGLIDDVRLYSHALTADEIGTDMVTPVGSSSGDCSGATVDDGNPCTLDACDSTTGNITHTPVATGTSCSDGNFCNGAETCNASAVCVAGTPPTVDDGNPCTTDTCDASAGVTHTPVAAGTSCSDGNVCNGAETCDASAACVAGTPPSLDDGNPCTADTCDPSVGVTHIPVSVGTSCSDGNTCNGAETCDASAACVAGTPPTTDDGNPCTADACDPVAGITHTPVATGTSCSDGNLCNGAETCNASAACVAGTSPTVDDGNPCTADACDPSTGVTHTPVAAGTSCSDGNVCNGAETCNASATCVAGTPPTIDDGNPCTDDTCSPTAGVTHTPRAAGSSCSDFDLCNGNETCDGSGSCKPGTPVAIDTSNPCRAGTCDPATGVVTYAPLAQGTTCVLDICTTGACSATGECTASGSTAHDDGNPCTLEWCDPVKGPQQTTCSTLDRTVATTLNDSMKWLYTGSNPIQQGVVAGTIVVEQTVALHGQVTTRDGSPLPGVTVSILGRPEFGHTLTQSNGAFDMVVNGGGTLIVDYQRQGYLRIQRQLSSNWNDYAALPDVVMIPPDPVVTTMDMSGGTNDTQIAQASIQTDDSGTRQAVLLVPSGTQATMHLPDGTTQPLNSMNVRITEYTVGANGEKAMPGNLPGESKYTYAFDVNADEAVAANATTITFSSPLVHYVDNFLRFPAGTAVPLGFYDTTKSAWVPADSGIAVDIVGVSGGRAQLDITGDGVADSASVLAARGITDTEQQKLAQLYTPGRMLWRVLIPHFSGWDENWGGGPPGDATGPNGGSPGPDGNCQDTCCSASSGTGPGTGNVKGASTIHCDSQVLYEKLPIAGTPFSLNYSSERVPGDTAQNQITIPLSASTVPASLLQINLDISVDGVSHHQEFPPTANQTTKFTWDGFDAFGRRPQGAVIAEVTVGYVYDYTYTHTDRFGYNGNGLTIIADKQAVQAGQFATRCSGPNCPTGPASGTAKISVAQAYRVPIGALDAKELGLGGWTLDVQHVHEPLAQRLELGNGQRLDSTALPPSLDFIGEGANSLQGPFAMGPDKTAYLAGFNRVWRLSPGQAPVPFAGNGNTSTYGGDGLPATDPAVGLSALDVAVGRDNSVYIADRANQIVRRVGPDGIIHTIAGIPGSRSIPANNGPATSTPMADPAYVAVASDGTAYVSTDANIMKITTDGNLVRVAGLVMTSLGGNAVSPPPDGVATSIRIEPHGLAVAPDGTLYAILGGCNSQFCDFGTAVVKFVDGVMSRVVGSGCVTCSPAWTDGDLATLANIRPTGLAFDNQGTLYISDIAGTNSATFQRVAELTPDGRLFAVAGIPKASASGLNLLATQGVPATNALLAVPSSRFAISGPDGVYVENLFQTRVDLYRLAIPLPHDTGTNSIISSRNENAYFNFDASGRHLSTKHSLTGADLYRFGYDSQGHIATITDASNQVTTVERDGTGNPTGIVGPFGQRTALELDTNGYLASVTDPEGNNTLLGYQDGLLTSLTDPRGFTSTMHYASDGRLDRDTDAAGSSQTLSRTESTTGWTVTRSTALGHATTYAVTRQPTDHRTRVETAPDGTTSQLGTGPDKITQRIQADGTAVASSEAPDPRFGLNAPVISRTTTLPSGLSSTETTTRSYTNLNPTNILDFSDTTDQRVVNGQTWRTTYTPSNKTFITRTPANRTSTRVIDVLGRTAATQLDSLAAVNFFYDANGRLDHTTQGSGALARTTNYAYAPTGNSAGYLQSITDALSDATTYTRDTLGRTRSETRAGTTTAFTWDPESDLASVTPPGKPIHDLAYTPVNLLQTYSPPLDGLPIASTSYTYDADQMLRTETRPDGVQIVRTPDSAGRLSTVQIPGGMLQYNYYAAGAPSGAGETSDILGPYGTNLHFTYDGMLTTSTTWSGDVTGSVAWTYNSDFNRILETVNGASGSAQAAFGYDADQLLTCVSPTTCSPPGSDALTLTRNTAGLVSNITLGSTSETLSYNTFGELARQTATFAPSTPLADITYDAPGVERDALGRIVQKTEVIGGTTNVYRYTYDHLRRLTDVMLNGSLAEHFEYDANGNRTLGFNAAAGTTYTGTYDDQDRLLSYGPFDFTYTANGELETKKNRTTGEEWIFGYDALGNLLNVGLPNGDLVEYLVDGVGRRVGKKKNGVLLKQWIYRDALKPVAELDGSGALVSEFVYGTRSNAPDYVRRGGNTYRVVTDHLGSPRYVVNVANASDVPFTATYTSFGVVTGTGLDWMPFGFAGGHYDLDSGLVRFGVRDFDSIAGRWTAKDPIRFGGLQNDLYAHVGNDPVNLTDPLGLWGIFGGATGTAGSGPAINVAGGGFLGFGGSSSGKYGGLSGGIEWPPGVGGGPTVGFFTGDLCEFSNADTWFLSGGEFLGVELDIYEGRSGHWGIGIEGGLTFGVPINAGFLTPAAPSSCSCPSGGHP